MKLDTELGLLLESSTESGVVGRKKDGRQRRNDNAARMKGRLVSETVNRSRDATAEVNEFLRVAARDANGQPHGSALAR